MPTRPTRDETRFFVFHALTASTDGFIWYWGPRTHYRMVEDAPTVWNGIVETSQLLKRLEPWLVALPKAEDKSIQVREPFRVWTREVDGKRLLVLVNTGKKSQSIDLNLGAFKPKAVTNFETGAEVALAEGRLKAEVASQQVLIYQLNQ
jgi:alpha-tubulin suppressor-like RCC1 family protein